MVDFLTRLAERTLRTVPVAQPIVASMFAPQQFMTASIHESWRIADAAPMQDAASMFRAEAGSVTTMQGKPGNHASLHLEQEALVEANSTAGDRVGINQPEINRPGTSRVSTSPIQLANGAKSTMYRGDPPHNELPTEVSILAGDLQERVDQSPVDTINRPLLSVGEDVGQNAEANLGAGSPGLSLPQTGSSEFDAQDSVIARLIPPAVLSPQPFITKQLPAATEQLPEEDDTSGVASKEAIRAPQATNLRPASGVTFQQGEPLALEQEEPISPQSVADHNNIVPVALTEQPGMFLQRDTSSNPLVERAFHSIVASHSQVVSPETNMVGAPLIDVNVTKNRPPVRRGEGGGVAWGGPLWSPGGGGLTPQQLQLTPMDPAPTKHDSATHETYIVGAPLAGAMPGATGALPGPADALPGGEPAPAIHNQSHTISPTSNQKGDKAAPGRPQPPSPPRTTGQVDVLPAEQHLLVLQAQVSQETVPQEQKDAPLINFVTPGLRRNPSQSRSDLSQPDHASIRQDPVTTPQVDSVPTAPTIHITIGRIDVRAVTSQAPISPSKPARPGPLLSLDDYLKQSKGGG